MSIHSLRAYLTYKVIILRYHTSKVPQQYNQRLMFGHRLPHETVTVFGSSQCLNRAVLCAHPEVL